MFPYLTTSCRRAFPQLAGLTFILTLGFAVGGCSSLWHHDNASSPEAPAAAAVPPPPPPVRRSPRP